MRFITFDCVRYRSPKSISPIGPLIGLNLKDCGLPVITASHRLYSQIDRLRELLCWANWPRKPFWKKEHLGESLTGVPFTALAEWSFWIAGKRSASARSVIWFLVGLTNTSQNLFWSILASHEWFAFPTDHNSWSLETFSNQSRVSIIALKPIEHRPKEPDCRSNLSASLEQKIKKLSGCPRI